MIQILCNACGNKINLEDGFLFEASINEIVPTMYGKNITVQKQQKKTVIHICQECYEKNIKNLWSK